MEKIKKQRRALEAERKDLQHQLDEARSKAEAEAERSTKTEDQGYRRGRDESDEFFQELLVTLALNALCIEGYFEA